jgi:phosphatidylserine decarboxylase
MSEEPGPTLGARLFAALQYVLPKHLLSRLIYKLMRSRAVPLRNALLRGFLRGYAVDMAEALQPDPFAYPSFNAFFTRALRAEARPLAAGSQTLLSPVDGTVSQRGSIDGDQLFQAKGRHYSLDELLAGDRAASERYRGGTFACIYLAPYNYHRIHMPCSGRLRSTVYVPGDLFSVNTMTVRTVPRVFARNERVICEFDTAAGPMALIPVGALFVGSMELVYCGEINPPPRLRRAPLAIPTGVGTHLAKGAELGRFNMGSTVILLFPPGAVALSAGLQALGTVRMGESMGELLLPASPSMPLTQVEPRRQS